MVDIIGSKYSEKEIWQSAVMHVMRNQHNNIDHSFGVFVTCNETPNYYRKILTKVMKAIFKCSSVGPNFFYCQFMAHEMRAPSWIMPLWYRLLALINIIPSIRQILNSAGLLLLPTFSPFLPDNIKISL